MLTAFYGCAGFLESGMLHNVNEPTALIKMQLILKVQIIFNSLNFQFIIGAVMNEVLMHIQVLFQELMLVASCNWDRSADDD